MAEIKRQLEALRPEIDDIIRIGGAPGLSLGVLHYGKFIHTAHFGCRNADDATPSSDNTIHSICSLTKLLTASAVAKLVHEGVLDWDIPVREYLPTFRLRQDELGMKATLKDLLSMRTGITAANSLLMLQDNEPLMKPGDTTGLATNLRTAKPYGQFLYSQWNYTLVADIVKEVTGASICDYIQQNIFGPLNMTRSSFSYLQDLVDDDVTHTHCTHDDGTQSQKPDAASALIGTGAGAVGGARSSVKDYMTFLQAILHAYRHQITEGVDITPGSIFPLIREVFTAQVGLGPPERSGIEHVAYCMGLYRTKLPGFLSLASPNFYYTLGKKRLAPYGKSLAGTDVYHHSGTALGHLGALFLVPSTESAVVAFTNSQPLMDPADFVAQLALSRLLGPPPSLDFVKLAKLARAITLDNYKVLEDLIAKGRTDVPPTKPLAAYQGDFYNAIHNFVFSVSVTDDGLNIRLQRGKTNFDLLPYDGDTFYWRVDREEEMCKKGMWGFMYKDWHLFRFEINSHGEVEKLLWKHDPYLASPEAFTKTPTFQAYARL
ncbi:beta-lactamase/transpeptidase-like protein [Karstenula rhodostoma CBS 690.94]|uniref:Beta-lactamase/transpeptidase-like protein n=1 Tax=Karstenula rhodostoma CBS 690.94 TaxID=1392251 RepID=A0A9P4PPK5_9PLEO|nr:beta-lactamase/transpeptidase-like protein [Karstenula rhodostoma CBS 690.94]